MPPPIIQQLLQRGVLLPQPETVFVHGDVVPDRVAAGAVIHPGCRILGAMTSIGPDCEIGAEAPATVEDCQLGHKVALKGGYFSGATFLDGANVGSGAHVRAGTLLEEDASAAHAVGLKQTILQPFVTLGSLINFCDVLMAGGTSRKNHSEVGSSYIHFNYTPHQDKATASLVGDVPRGVFLDQSAIFLGGQGGLAGPCRIAYGCIIPAGLVHRTDALEPGMLLNPPASLGKKAIPYQAGAYGKVDRLIANNLIYLGNIRALQEWYRCVRSPFMSSDPYRKHCHEGATRQLADIWKERLKRLGELAEKFTASMDILKREPAKYARALAQQESFVKQWPAILKKLSAQKPSEIGARERDQLLAELGQAGGAKDYVKAVQALRPGPKTAGTAWLQAIVDSFALAWQSP